MNWASDAEFLVIKADLEQRLAAAEAEREAHLELEEQAAERIEELQAEVERLRTAMERITSVNWTHEGSHTSAVEIARAALSQQPTEAKQ